MVRRIEDLVLCPPPDPFAEVRVVARELGTAEVDRNLSALFRDRAYTEEQRDLAFELLLALYKPALGRVAGSVLLKFHKITPGEFRALSEANFDERLLPEPVAEALQILNRKLRQAASSFRDHDRQGPFGPWAKKAAQTAAHQVLRDNRIFRDHSRTQHPLEEFLQSEPGQVDPPTPAEQAESAKIIQQILSALDPLDRDILRLYFFFGYTQQQIGEELGMSTSAVCIRIQKALQTLRNRLGEDGDLS